MLNQGGASSYKQSLSKQIISTASTAFLSKGIKAVKMDDIAAKLSISKRTLYELFATKEQLLLECVKQIHEEFKNFIEGFIKKENPSAIAVFIETYRYQMDKLNSISSAYYNELHKYPSVIEWIENDNKLSEGESLEFYRRGVEEGYFRADINFELVSKVANATRQYIIEKQILKKYSMKQIFQNIILLNVRGLCTNKGIKALEEYNL